MAASYAQRRALGDYGEQVAADHLVAAGMTILERNYRCRHGEIDIVALDGDTVVVCEVKTRRGGDYGTPLEAVTAAKCARLRRLAGHWTSEHAPGTHGIRIDAISVIAPARGRARVERMAGVA